MEYEAPISDKKRFNQRFTPYYQTQTIAADYKPPPSAPAGVNPRRNRIKMFTSLQPRPYKLVGDPIHLPS